MNNTVTKPYDGERHGHHQGSPWYLIFILLILIGIGVAYYFCVYKKKQGKISFAKTKELRKEDEEESLDKEEPILRKENWTSL